MVDIAANTASIGANSVAISSNSATIANLGVDIGLLDNRVSSLEGQVASFFDLATTMDKDAQQGIAAVAAMAHPHFPSEAGKTSYASNIATYRGELGFSMGLMHRLEGDIAVTAGATYGGGKSLTFKAGIAGEF